MGWILAGKDEDVSQEAGTVARPWNPETEQSLVIRTDAAVDSEQPRSSKGRRAPAPTTSGHVCSASDFKLRPSYQMQTTPIQSNHKQ